jgi:hypothetical protein
VIAEDAYGNTASSYSGTVHFIITDRYGKVPADTTFTNGVGTFPVTFGTVGPQSITATDSANSLTGTSNAIAVTHGPAALFGIRVRSTTITDGVPFVFNA